MYRRIAVVALVFGFAMGNGVFASAEAPNFVTRCRYSHSLPDDPIVFPGQPGASHSHDFFANTSTNASSTYESLRAGTTTCRSASDTAAYWAPSLMVDGDQVAPLGAQIYYRPGPKDPRRVKPFPANLRMIAGDSHSTEPQSRMVTSWGCSGESGVPNGSDVPACPDGSHLVLHVTFPDCWDGRNLDSADHQSHMAYATRGGCPRTHRVSVPRISFNVHYPTAGGPGVTLASGGRYSGHADFVNAWDQQALKQNVRNCLNAGVHCGLVA